MNTTQTTPQFQTWKFKKAITDEGQAWYWAEYYFKDAEGLLVASSPVYIEGSSDFQCLPEDAFKVAAKLRAGEPWEQVCKLFRESW